MAQSLTKKQLKDIPVIPAGAEFASQLNRDGFASFPQNRFHQWQIAQQAGTAVALDHLVYGAAEVDIDNVEATILAHLGGFG